MLFSALPDRGMEASFVKYNLKPPENSRIIEDKSASIYRMIFAHSVRYNIPLSILGKLIDAESEFDKSATNWNSNGTFDAGLMQLNSSNYAEFKWRFNNGRNYDPYDPETNLRIGCQYLSWIYSNRIIGQGSWYKTLVFWNGSKKSSRIFAKNILRKNRL
jgi:soluble lytic murein transglycosylase-like protein